MTKEVVSNQVWFSRYIPDISPDFSQKDAQTRARLFENLEKAVDTLERAKSAEKVRVDAILDVYKVSDMASFMNVFIPPADSGLWPTKQDGTRLTPQAVALRVQGDKLDGLSEFAIASCLYLRALERGVRRIVAKEKRAESKGKGETTESAESKGKGESTSNGESAVSVKYSTLQAQISLLDSIVSGAISALGKADAAVVLSAVIAECQAKAQAARLELLKLQGKPAPEMGKAKGRGKAIKIFA